MTRDRRHPGIDGRLAPVSSPLAPVSSQVAPVSRPVRWASVAASTTGLLPRAARTAFTLVELMVVITIMAIAVALLVPAFGGLMRSINYSNAINTVSATLGQARALAIRDRRHTAVAFLYDTQREICSLQVLELQSLSAGSLSISANAPAFVYRPATGQVPVELPKGTAVYALSFQVADRNAIVDSRTPDWYAGWEEEAGDPDSRASWLFPMNDPRQFLPNNPPDRRFVGVDPWEIMAGRTPEGVSVSVPEAGEAVRAAQTFAIQFSPEGSVVTTPRAGETYIRDAYIEYASAPVDRSNPSEDPYDWPDRFDPDVPEPYLDRPPPQEENRSPNPEVFIRSADQLAVVDMNQLAQGTTIVRPWYVRPRETLFPQPAWLDEAGYFEEDRQGARHRLVSDWIDANAEILSFDRYSGKVIRRESP